MNVNTNDLTLNLLNSSRKSFPFKKNIDFYARKSYNKPKGSLRKTGSLNLTKAEIAPKIDETVKIKLDELTELSKAFSDKMKILDGREIKEINTKENWDRLNFARSSIMQSLGAKKNKRNLRFSFSEHQKEFENNWLSSLRNITSDRQLHVANLLMNGGYDDKDIANCLYLIENEVKKLEEKMEKGKGPNKFRRKLNNFVSMGNRVSILKDLEDRNAKIDEYCSCFITHRLKRNPSPKNYQSIIIRSRPLSPEKFIENLREKLNIKSERKKELKVDSSKLQIDSTSKIEEISFINTERQDDKKGKFTRRDKLPLPSITYLEKIYRHKWNRTKSLNPKNLFTVKKKHNKTVEEIIKENEKLAKKQLKQKIGYSSKPKFKSSNFF